MAENWGDFTLLCGKYVQQYPDLSPPRALNSPAPLFFPSVGNARAEKRPECGGRAAAKRSSPHDEFRAFCSSDLLGSVAIARSLE